MLASQLDLSQSRDKARPSPVSDPQGTLLSNSVLQHFHDKPSHVPHMVLDFDTRKSCLSVYNKNNEDKKVEDVIRVQKSQNPSLFRLKLVRHGRCDHALVQSNVIKCDALLSPF